MTVVIDTHVMNGMFVAGDTPMRRFVMPGTQDRSSGR